MDDPRLLRFIDDTSRYLRDRISAGNRVVIEGTQGFGLSLLDGGYWPKATSRATTAAAALAETGLSPSDVDDVTMVIRSFPIRVAGDSGPLVEEISWGEVAVGAGRPEDSLREFSTVTGRVRRIGRFDPRIVQQALAVNRPDNLVLNHLDYIGNEHDIGNRDSGVYKFIRATMRGTGRDIDWYGFSPFGIVARECRSRARS